ncbi:ABC transporter C family member [Arachis hypogaea]|nr:ABC transporter C family member [Arachis hypogaea]
MSELVRMIPEALSILIQVVVSFDRLNTFLLTEELGSNEIIRSVKQSSVGDNNAVEIEGGNFTWDSRPPVKVIP